MDDSTLDIAPDEVVFAGADIVDNNEVSCLTVVDEEVVDSSNMKKLKFMHITKCGGTIIEEIAKTRSSVLWGKYDTEYEEGIKAAPPPWSLVWWSYPPHYMESKCLQNILEKYDFFTIVRNPYDRIISEYYCKWAGPAHKASTAEEFNQYINDRLLKLKYDISVNAKLESHYVPQYLYLYKESTTGTFPTTTSTSPLQRICNNIIHIENFVEEFNELMIKYNYDYIRLSENDFNINIMDNLKLNVNHKTAKKMFMVQDFSEENLALIQELYEKDFALFNYDMGKIESSFEHRNQFYYGRSQGGSHHGNQYTDGGELAIIYPLPNSTTYKKNQNDSIFPANDHEDVMNEDDISMFKR